MPRKKGAPVPDTTSIPGAKGVGSHVPRAYSRAEALRNGELIDVTEAGERLGFTMPVAVTSALWMRHVHVEADDDSRHEEQARRLQDLLLLGRLAVLRSREPVVHVFCLFVLSTSEGPQPLAFKAWTSRGDRGELVLTLVLPHEA